MADVGNKIKTTLELETAAAEAKIKKVNAISKDSSVNSAKRLKAKNDAVKAQNKLSIKTEQALKKEAGGMKALGNYF